MQIRTDFRPDGSCEIVRVLDRSILRHWSRENPWAFESSIVWLQPLDRLDFVRVGIVTTAKSRRGPLLCRDVAVLGYSKLTSDAPRHPVRNAYVRRLFYLLDEDSLLNMNQFPPEAIDPRTILPGEPGQPPSVAELERGYPAYMSRARLGLPMPSANRVAKFSFGADS